LILLLLIGTGCLVKTEVLRQGLVPIPEDAKGWLYIATNKPIQIGLEGTKHIFKKDVGGYYLIHRADLEAIMKKLKKEVDKKQ